MNKLHFYNRKEAIARMNRFGARGTAFFFLINFDETECLVSELKDISPDRLAFIFPKFRMFHYRLLQSLKPFIGSRHLSRMKTMSVRSISYIVTCMPGTRF